MAHHPLPPGTTGHLNSCLGYQAGAAMTSGSQNIFIGVNDYLYEVIVKCTACKEPYDLNQHYLIYKGSKFTRHICDKCQTKAEEKFLNYK